MLSRRAFAAGLPTLAALGIGPALAQGSDTLTVALGAESTTLDPTVAAAGVDYYMINDLFEQMLRPDPGGQRINWLAESWTVGGAPDKPIIDITLREGVLFHDNTPLTSADFEFAYQLMGDPKHARNVHQQADVEAFEIVDPRRFRLHFKQPDALYLALNFTLWAVPKKYYEQVGREGFNKAPIGTGPWKFVSRSVHEELRLEAFEGYWNKAHRPRVKNLVIKVIPEDLTRVAAFKTGAVDWIDAVPPSMLSDFAKLPGVSTRTVASGNNLFLNLAADLPNSPLKDVRVRRAVALAVDMDAIIKKVLFGQGERYSELVSGEPGYDPTLTPYPYDPKQARELLRDAGYPNGFDVICYNLTTPREPSMKEMGEAEFAYLSQVGIRCRTQQLEYGAWITTGLRNPTGPRMDGIISWMSGHGVPPDPGSAWAGQIHTYMPNAGWGGYSFSADPELDALVEQQRRILDPEQRAAVLNKIAHLKHERVLGGITTYRPLVTFAWRTDKVDWTPWPAGYWRTFQEVALKA